MVAPATQDREASATKLQRMVAQATAPEEAVESWRLRMAQWADYTIELRKAPEKVTSLGVHLEAFGGELAMVTNNLTTAAKRNGQVRTELAAA